MAMSSCNVCGETEMQEQCPECFNCYPDHCKCAELPEPNFYLADYVHDAELRAAIEAPHYAEDCPDNRYCPAHYEDSAIGKMLSRFFNPWKHEDDN